MEKIPVRIIKKPQFFSFENKFFSLLAGLVFAGMFCSAVYVFATAGVDSYFTPGASLNPSCAPGATYCSVAAPLSASVANTGNYSTTGSFSNAADNAKHYFGASDDASIYYDGTNLVLNPDEEGSGKISINNVYTLPTADGTSGYVLKTNGSGTVSWSAETDSVVAAINGLVKSNGTTISAATSGTDYAPATSGTSLLKGNGSGGFSSASAGDIPDLSATYSVKAGNTSLTTVGTIATGVWNGTAVTVAYGGTGKTSLTAYGLLAAGTTTTGALQQVSGTGTSGQVLTSNGASALPTWQNGAWVGTATSELAMGGNSISGVGAITTSGTITTNANYIYAFQSPYTGTLGSSAGVYGGDGTNLVYLANGTQAILATGSSNFNGSVNVNGSLVVTGTATIQQDLIVEGSVTVNGKITATGGVDPAYMLFDANTRKSLADRVAGEVPDSKKMGAVLFYNQAAGQMEIYMPWNRKFYTVTGTQLNENGAMGSGTVSGLPSGASMVESAKTALSALGLSMKDGATNIVNLVANKFTANTITVKNFQLVSSSGDIYCTWVDDKGEIVSLKGECSAIDKTTGTEVSVSTSSTAPLTGGAEPPRTAAEQAAGRAAEQAAGRAAEQAANRAAEQAAGRASQALGNVAESAQKVIENAKQLVETATNEVVNNATNRIVEKATQQVVDQATQQVVTQVNQANTELPEQAQARPVETPAETSSGSDSKSAPSKKGGPSASAAPASEAANAIKEAAAGLLDGAGDFIRWLFTAPFNGSAEKSEALKDGLPSSQAKTFAAGLLEPFKNLLKIGN